MFDIPSTRLLELAGIAKGPTIADATERSGHINRKTADRILDPKGYFKRSKSYYGNRKVTETDLTTAAVNQHDAMRSTLAQIDEDVAKLARLMTGDNVQPSGRWGSAHEMLLYLIDYATKQRYG